MKRSLMGKAGEKRSLMGKAGEKSCAVEHTYFGFNCGRCAGRWRLPCNISVWSTSLSRRPF